MLYCGRDWRPTFIKRVIETYETSTRVAKVGTDAGTGFLKGMGNPAGNISLATELVAGELAAWFGLRIPPFAVVRVAGIEIPMASHGFIQDGPAFISKEMLGATGDGGNTFLSRLNNPADISKLVVFDTWIRNADRCAPKCTDTPQNLDNLFFTPAVRQKFDVVVLDHSHCFVETTFEAELGSPHLLEDDRVYGLFSGFEPFICPESVTRAIERLRQFDSLQAKQIVDSVPAEWGLSAAIREAFADLIFRRAQRVAGFIPGRLLDEPYLDFFGVKEEQNRGN